MYCYKLLETPRKCAAGCGTTVVNRLAGHYYRDPLCESCFRKAAPEVVEAIKSLDSASIRFLGVGAVTACADCGDRLTRRMAGHHRGDLFCVRCFHQHAPELVGLLLLHEAALEAASVRSAEDLFIVAAAYATAFFSR